MRGGREGGGREEGRQEGREGGGREEEKEEEVGRGPRAIQNEDPTTGGLGIKLNRKLFDYHPGHN